MNINTLDDLKTSQNFLTRCYHSYDDLPLFVSLRPHVFYGLGLDEDGIFISLSIIEDLYKGEDKFPVTCKDSNENFIKIVFSFELNIVFNNDGEKLCYIAVPLSADFKRLEQVEHDHELISEGTNYYNHYKPILIY